MELHPLLPWTLLLFCTTAALLLVFLEYRRLRVNFRAQACRLLLGWRLLTLVCVLLLLLRPHNRESHPNLSRLKTVILTDCSGSMGSESAPGKTRLARAEETLNAPEAQRLWAQIGHQEWLSFASKVERSERTGSMVSLSVLPGESRIGEALGDVLRLSEQGVPVGSVLLVSDGHELGGRPALDVARQFRQRGIPVSVLSFPETGQRLDVRVVLDQHQLSVLRHERFALTGQVAATGTEAPREVIVELVSDSGVLATQTVAVPGTFAFETALELTGHQHLSVRLRPPGVAGDSRRDNDEDHALVQVNEPAQFNVLYLGWGPDWEWRFLRLLSEQEEQLSLSAIIRTGKETYFRLGENVPEDGFPERAEQYASYDAIVVDGELLSELSPDVLTALRAFVEHKGGGLLLRGRLPTTPLSDMLPGTETRELKLGRDTGLAFDETGPVFRGLASDELSALQRLRLAAPKTLSVLSSLRRSARPLVALETAKGASLLTVQAYGAGRVAHLGLSDSWRWALGSDEGQQAHRLFWRQLLVWLSETGKPLLRVRGLGERIPVYDAHGIQLEVLGDDFRPAESADVQLEVTSPSGVKTTLPVLGSLEQAGHFTAEYCPLEVGVHRLSMSATRDGRTLTGSGVLLASAVSKELEDTSVQLPLLADIARMTGGRVFTPESFLSTPTNIPVSANVPKEEQLTLFIPSWVLLALLVLVASCAWWQRRRLGLG